MTREIIVLQYLHLRDFFFQGTARQGDAQGVYLETQFRHALFLRKAPGTKIPFVIMAV